MLKKLKDIPQLNFDVGLITHDRKRGFYAKTRHGLCDNCGKNTWFRYFWRDVDNNQHQEKFCSYECLSDFDDIIPIQLNEVTLVYPIIKTIEVTL